MPAPVTRNDTDATAVAPFWRRKPLEAMNATEWESLCDRCGRCCLVKLEDEETGTVHYTDVACRLFDAQNCRCSNYAGRQRQVHDCIKLTPASARALKWLPPTCAYRQLAEGKDLAWWHPLVSGSPESVHSAGVSVRGRIGASETEMAEDDYPDRIVRWPKRVPAKAKPNVEAAAGGRRR
jgi:uncharacterized cysteine cluster protein YcgN (CxxCxxCC family)